jgi:hypothetical protein
MSRGIVTSLACDYTGARKITTSTSSSSQVFTPADGPQSGLNGKPSAIVSDEVTVHNIDPTNAVWVRFQLSTNEVVSQGISTAQAGVGGSNINAGGQSFGTQPLSVDSSKFIAATDGTAGELYVPPATLYKIRVRAVGLTVIAVAGTPILNVWAVGAANFA